MTLKIVAVIGAVGGAGATAASAHLASALFRQYRDALAFDLSTENRLRLYFGMALRDPTGWAAELLHNNDWYDAAYVGSNGPGFVPFGQLESDAELDRLCLWLRDNPLWLRNQLNSLNVAPDTIVVCDCPRMPAALREQTLDAADLVLLITPPDSIAYGVATEMARRAAHEGNLKTFLVLNGFDPARRLDRDISVLLRTQHKERFSPVVVHRDESLREALACKQTVFDFAPSSQSAYDFSALATWTLAKLGQVLETA